ncbi:MAG: hypothetical protein UY50_C0014G0004 [Parcubacteria group bacterium GW2011_GWA2_49_9]|nr:MAG: hypothetical protein UY50_C0014G0004 [Parcubacteria group bacterium GW2011_GWA2_49_9]
MLVLPIKKRLLYYLRTHGLEEKFEKQRMLFEINPYHPSLNLELLEPKRLRYFSFRVDRKYRAVFIFIKPEMVEIIDINNHYR